MAKSKNSFGETDDDTVSTASDNAGAVRSDAPAAQPSMPAGVAGASSLNPQVPNNGAATKGDDLLHAVKKGDLVRLLEPHYDGFQRFEAGSVVRWWNDDPPSSRNVCLPDAEQTPLDAPPMTDGKPPADYVDPSTGKKPVIGSV